MPADDPEPTEPDPAPVDEPRAPANPFRPRPLYKVGRSASGLKLVLRRLKSSPRRTLKIAILLALAVVAAILPSLSQRRGSGNVVRAEPVELAPNACADCVFGGEYFFVNPVRVLDTTEGGMGLPIASSDGPESAVISTAGVAGLPPIEDSDGDGDDDNVLSVALSISITQATHPGVLNLPLTNDIIQFDDRRDVTQMVFTRPGTNRTIPVRLSNDSGLGTAHVSVDIVGWVSTSKVRGFSGNRLFPIEPTRVYDSRAIGKHLDDKSPRLVHVLSAAEIASAAAQMRGGEIVGVAINVFAFNNLQDSIDTHLSLSSVPPSVGDRTARAVSASEGSVDAGAIFMPIASAGEVWVTNAFGETDVAIDILGLIVSGVDPQSRRGRLAPFVISFEAFETRDQAFGGNPLPPSTGESWDFSAFAGDVRLNGEHVGPQMGLVGVVAAQSTPRLSGEIGNTSDLAVGRFSESFEPPTGANVAVHVDRSTSNLALLAYTGFGDEKIDDVARVNFYNSGPDYVHYRLNVSAVILSD